MEPDLNYIDATIADLEARRDHLDSMIEGLRQLREQGLSPLPTGIPNSATPRPEKEIRHDSFFGMTILDGIQKYLGITKTTKSAPDIAKALASGGMKSAAKDFTGNVRTTLSKNGEFVKVNGEWGLADCYRKKARTGAEAETPLTRKAPPRKAIPRKAPTTKNAETLTGRILKLLASNATQTFSSPEVAERLGANAPSVAAALSTLLKSGKVERPETGRYNAKRAA